MFFNFLACIFKSDVILKRAFSTWRKPLLLTDNFN